MHSVETLPKSFRPIRETPHCSEWLSMATVTQQLPDWGLFISHGPFTTGSDGKTEIHHLLNIKNRD